MGIDGLVALVAGWSYDRYGLITLTAVPFFAGLAGITALQNRLVLIVAGTVAWGIAMGLVETTMRAAVGDLTPREARGLAYGIFNTLFGAAWLGGGLLLGLLYQHSGPTGAMAAVVAAQISALLFFFGLGVARAHREHRARVSA
jgi:predicted MFS family arabinose efflux permease